MDHPLVTIGITCYNNAAYIRQSLESVLNQTWPEIEIIVVDDASTDDSLERIADYADRYRLIRHQANSGGEMRGRCDVIEGATGAYVGHLDADDYLEPDFISQHMEAFLADSELDWVAGNLNIVDGEGNRTGRWDYRDFPTDPFIGLRRGYQTASVPVPKNGLFSTEFLRRNSLRWYDLPHTANGSDAITCIKYLECAPKIRLLPYYGLNYRTHDSNLCRRAVERIKMTIDLKEYYISQHNELVYLFHPTLLRFPYQSDEYLATKYFLIAVDFYRTMQNFAVPEQFNTPETASEVQRNLGLFEEPIMRYAQKSLEYAPIFAKDLEVILRAIGRRAIDVQTPPEPPEQAPGDTMSRYTRMLAENPHSVEALNGMAEALYANGDIEGAQEYAATAVRVAPHDATTLNNAGTIAYSCGRHEEAEILFRRALASDPGMSDAHYNLCELWGRVAKNFAPDPQRTRDLLGTTRWIANHDPDQTRNTLMSENHHLRNTVRATYKNRFSAAGQRVLLHRPSNGALKYLMDSWREVLEHMGIETDLLNWGERTAEKFEAFRPDVFITVADPNYIDQLNYDYVTSYRRDNGLKIGHITTFEHEFPPCDFLLTFHLDPSRDPQMKVAETPLLSVPFAANPMQHYMRPGREVWDYFFVGTNSPVKIQPTKDYLLPIVQRYSGLLAGTGWNVGVGELPMKEAARMYNFARVYPNYSCPRQFEAYNEVNERTFIIPACGGFQLIDSPVAVRELFTDDELAIADSAEQYLEMFDHYLRHPEERLPIIRKGMQRVYRDYTLFQVLERLALFVGMKSSAADSGEIAPVLIEPMR